MIETLAVFLLISLCFNAFQFKKHRNVVVNRKPDKLAQEVLADLFSHGAYIHIQRLDPRDFYLRVQK